MSIPVKSGMETLRQEGPSKFSYEFLRYLNVWVPAWNTITSRRPFGANVFERDWDVLVVLDACRVDSLREFTPTFPWLDSIGSLRSVGSMSAEWMLKTFTEAYLDEIARTALVSRNVWSQRVLVDRLHEHDNDPANRNYDMIRRGYPNWSPVAADALEHYERVEPVANQDQRLHPESSSIPQIVTDRAISVGRNVDFDRLVVWYRMPHLNFFADAVDWSPDDSLDALMSGLEPTRSLRPEEKSAAPVKEGDVSRETMRELYLGNLHLVLSYVDILLENIEAEDVVISADHGEGLGETVWKHPYACPFAPVKTVPWAKTTATDERTYTSQYDELEETPLPDERKEMLKNMGYI
jgi:hypothetical protein